MLPGEAKTVGSNTAVDENGPILVESCKRIIHQFESCGINYAASSKVAELEEGTESAHHLLGNVAFNCGEVHLQKNCMYDEQGTRAKY
jgi:hypothetical protein